MSYSINVSGHGVAKEDALDAFGDLVRRLRAAGDLNLNGSISGTENDESFSQAAGDVSDFDESVDDANPEDEEAERAIEAEVEGGTPKTEEGGA